MSIAAKTATVQLNSEVMDVHPTPFVRLISTHKRVRVEIRLTAPQKARLAFQSDYIHAREEVCKLVSLF